MATFKDILKIGSFKTNGSSTIEIRVIEIDGQRRLDIRKFVDTPKYTGPTQNGVALEPEVAKQLLTTLAAEAKQIEKALK